ncbi:hypothetical protein [Micromonospora orduensis]|uniref:hypothetical protein n=1 Tax=Micromonospora orduensis TaxID=1420891 RepID=UPI001ABFF721|nr:hypothetical protein [Micromonospora orduensis]
MTWADENAHPEPPIAGDETATLLVSLDRQRATLAWKTGGLDAAGLRARRAERGYLVTRLRSAAMAARSLTSA